MKSLVKTSLVLLALIAASTSMAQEVTQAQKDGSASRVMQCMNSKMPANWDAAEVIVFRTTPKLSVMNIARIKGSNKIVDIDMKGCDIDKQANDLLMFQAVIPAEQRGWKALHLTTEPKGSYSVFTDIAMAKSQVK